MTHIAGNGPWLVCGDAKGALRLYDVTGSQPMATGDLRGHTDTIHATHVVGDCVISGGRDWSVRIWDAASGMCGVSLTVSHISEIQPLLAEGVRSTTPRGGNGTCSHLQGG
jgi:WD40 repeat protein